MKFFNIELSENENQFDLHHYKEGVGFYLIEKSGFKSLFIFCVMPVFITDNEYEIRHITEANKPVKEETVIPAGLSEEFVLNLVKELMK